MSTHEMICEAFERYVEESERFEEKGIKACAGRARKALSEMAKLAKVRRAEISAKKESL